jgi:hypothetical protein
VSGHDDDIRYFARKQPGYRRRLLATKLDGLTLGELIDLLREVDEADNLRRRGLARD